ncbi:MAG TPA: sucrose-6-phosphate hydrolase [Candidatus Jeotgalibaca merdavium]|uniref:Sucrose-6-phosphate hydrolase n=1 Tax=Candidatus Jeotgalibaca merdavium TaxID=2838627 RepID=A0A9D2KX67_9LACT|nr:sucrose-6-phosphate hydrolase [Candidatus Jeotgalibaca merdavium]
MLPQKEWTMEEKYLPYDQWSEEYVNQLRASVQASKWRQTFHVQPETGLLNDPNGFSYHDGKWHLFYQAFPYGPVHGLKSWYKAESKDLIHWESQGSAILPDTDYDSHGAYSGSALPVGDDLRIFYTGNVRDEEWNRSSYQLGAVMKKDKILKLEKPLIDHIPEGYTGHFRDPQVFEHENSYYLVIGAQTNQEQGKILVYHSDDLKRWSLLGPLSFTKESMGYMIECPHLVGLSKTPILIFCPQGLDKTILDYDNLNPNAYIIGDFVDFQSLTFEGTTELRNLDDGFDVYASQAIDAPDGRTLCVSWLGLPENEYPVYQDGWTNCLSLVKELKVKGNQLYQYPVEEMNKTKRLLEEKAEKVNGMVTLHQLDENVYELEILLPENQQGTLYLLANKERTRYLKVDFDSERGLVEVDRTNVGIEKINETKSTRQSKLLPNKELKMNIFVDTSSVEIFFNDGMKVLSSLTFPEKEDTFIFLEMKESHVSTRLFKIE